MLGRGLTSTPQGALLGGVTIEQTAYIPTQIRSPSRWPEGFPCVERSWEVLGRFLFRVGSKNGQRGKTGWVGLGDFEFGLGMELVQPDKESVEKRRGSIRTERERVHFPCNSERGCSERGVQVGQLQSLRRVR